jgi:hypothetical protein
MGDKTMAKELSLQELENELQREQAKLEKLAALGASMELMAADGTTMTFETPGGVYCVVNEDEKKEEQESPQIYQEGPKMVTVEPTLFAKAKKQFVDSVVMPSIAKKAEKVSSRINELKLQIENLQQQQGTGLGE